MSAAERGIPVPHGSPMSSLSRAEAWLNAWATIDGGVTVSTERRLYPWRLPEQAEHDREAARLIVQLIQTPGLPQAVLIVVSARARAKAQALMRDFQSLRRSSPSG